MNETNTITEKSKLSSYKIVCAKLGFIMCVFYVCVLIRDFITYLISQLADEIGTTAYFLSAGIVGVMLIYMVPLLVAAILFKSFGYYNGKIGGLYKKPDRLAKKLGTFPAVYGLGYGVSLFTVLTMLFISKFTNVSAQLEDVFKSPEIEASANAVYVVFMVLSLVVFAPVFEELLCRGIMYDALKPYGNGVAIVVTAVLFGLMHGRVSMLLYTTALGLALGYIRYATNSLFIVTILHALVNGVTAILFAAESLREATNWENKLINTTYNIFYFAALVLIFVGVAAFLKKIPVIRKYKIENTWNEVSGKRKIALFFFSVPVLIMLVFAFDTHANNILLAELIKLIK
ncbi:MAG: CPBP family intramembrane metalloprotease [Oscillospiraceae bacterium]|nr:CPBP family intramembrane metalloprotease [Oscillospiraceae bacterium]